uniref:UBC core domain-containing protein n=2 Tax=Panagrolaimus TaxID=55784 RepID=A0A914Q2Y3_9BILA
MLSSRSAPAVQNPSIDEEDRRNYVTAEFSRLCQDPVDGVYITPLFTNYLIWKGFIMVRSGCYSGGTFRFTLTLSKDFPNSQDIPNISFDSPLFHPYLDPATQNLNLQGCFPTKIWKRDKNKIVDILLYLQEIFAVLTENFPLDPNSILNQNAAELFTRDFDNFQLRAEEIIAINQCTVYDPPNCLDPHVIIFSPWEHSQMEPIRRKLIGKHQIKTSTNSSSRTASDFSTKTAESNSGGDADDERAEAISYGSPESRRSSFEINFRGIDLHESESTISSRRMPTHEFSDLSSIDLESQPPSARESIMIENEPKNNNIATVADEPKKRQNEYFSVSNINEIHEEKEESEEMKSPKINGNSCWSEQTLMSKSITEALQQNNDENEEEPRNPVAFKIGTDSSSSAAELTDDPDFDNSQFIHSQTSSPIATPRGVNARSVSLFSDVLE